MTRQAGIIIKTYLSVILDITKFNLFWREL